MSRTIARIRKEHADAIAAEQTRIAEQRAAFESERKAFEASRVVLPVVEQAAPKVDQFPDATKMIEGAPAAQTEALPVTMVRIAFNVSEYREHTAKQLYAVAGKIRQLGAGYAADALSEVANAMRFAQYDQAIYNFAEDMPMRDQAIADATNAAIAQLG